jgi:DNA repair exonuclease SbcCD ATPase subunit
MGDLSHTCPVCGATFSGESELSRHLEEHKDQPVQTE